MPDYNRRMLDSVGLPAAVSENLYARFHFKETLLISFGIEAKSSRPGISRKCLGMTVSKKAVRFERFRFERAGGAREKRVNLSRREPGFFPFNSYHFAAEMHVYENLCEQGLLRIDDEKETTALVYRMSKYRRRDNGPVGVKTIRLDPA